MVKDGVLENVSEIYGAHNVPKRASAGKILCKTGYMMAGITFLRFKVHGVGGHGSEADKCKNPVPIAAEVYLALNKILDEGIKTNPRLKGSIPMFVGSTAKNVIPEFAVIEGTLRNFDRKFVEDLTLKMENTAKEICEKNGFEIEMNNEVFVHRAVENSEKQVDWLKKAVVGLFGEERLGEEGCPIYASEDFSEFTVDIPGCFWFHAHGINEPKVT